MEYLLLDATEKVSQISPAIKQAASEQKWEVGQTIEDRYEIQDIIAHDERKIIYQVRHCQWNIPLAVRSQLDKKSQVQFFHQAARWVELGKHPNVVSAYYVQNIAGMPRLFVEYVKSKTLQQLMQAGRQDLETSLDIAIQIGWGMEHAHLRGLLHGDLRPGNIFITEEREAKITDFRSRENMSLEYSPYMPPEQFDQDCPAQFSIDIYAFGAILYHLCMGELPFKPDSELNEEESLIHFKNMVLTYSLQPPHKLDPKIPVSLSQLIVECLSPNPESRPRHFGEQTAKLQQIYFDITGFPYPRTKPDQATLTAVDLNNRALSLLDLGQEAEAEAYLEQAVAANARCTGAVINLSLLRLRLGKISLTDLRNATAALLSEDREVTTFYRTKACLEKGGFLQEAREELDSALKITRGNRELLRLKAVLHLRLLQPDKAAEILEELVNCDNPALQDLYHLATCYIEKGQKEKARQLLEKAFILYPNDAYLTLASGVTMALQGKVEEAHTFFAQAALSGHFWSQLHLAELTAAFGDYIRTYNKATPALPTAAQFYERLLKRAPRMPRIRRAYAFKLQKELPDHLDKTAEEVRPLWSYARGLSGHTEGIHCMALSPDGRFVVTGGADKYLRVWEIASGACKNTMQAHAEGTIQLCISADGHLLVSIGRDNLVMVWDLIAGECVAKLEGHARDVTCIALTATGYLVTGSLDRTLRVWDLGALSCRSILKGHQDKINCVVVTPDGKYALSGSEDTRIGIWDVEAGVMVNSLEGHLDGVTCLAVSPDGRWLVSGGWDQKLRVHDINSGRLAAVLEGHTGTLNCITITPDSGKIISGGEDKTVRVWEITTGKCLYRLEGHTVDVTCMAVAPCSRFLVSGSWDHTLRVWDLNYGECMGILEGHSDLVNTVAITPNEKFIVSGGDDPILRVWMDLTTLSCAPFPQPPLSYLLQRPPSQHSNLDDQHKVQKLMAQGDEQLVQNQIVPAMKIYREIQNIQEFARNPRVINAIYQTAHKGQLKRLRPKSIWPAKVLSGHSGAVTCMAIAPTEDIMITGSKDGTLKMWDMKQGVCLRTLEGHSGAIACVEMNPNGRFVISGSHDKTLRLWELETGRCIYTMEGHGHWVEHTKFTPDGRRIVSASRDHTLRIWERKTGHRLYNLTGHTDWISALQMTSDGRYLISGSHDRSIRVWELESGQCVATLEKHNEHIKCIVCIPNTPFFISGGWDAVLYLWNLQSGDADKTFVGHESWINEVCTTSDGQRAISCSLDKTIRVWDIASQQCLATLKGHTQDVNHILITSDGNFCISSSWDNTLRVWDLSNYECCSVLKGHSDVVTTLQSVQNHRYIITGSKDQKITIWEIDWDWE